MDKAQRNMNLNLSSTQVLHQGNFRKVPEMSAHRILIVEDEAKLLSHLDRIIRDEGYSTFTCSSYIELETLLKIPVKRFDVIVLDRLLHGRDTAQLITHIKQNLTDTKLLVLSAINTPTEKTQTLDLGADDYVAKPFDRDELIARIRALLRRAPSEIRFGNVILDSERRTMKVGEQEVSLQNKEFILLRTLVRSPGKIFDKNYLYEHVWEMSTEVESNVVEATVNKLRRRLEQIDASFSIKSMRNKGYWIEE